MVSVDALDSILSVRNFVGIMALANVLIGWRMWILLPSLMERWNERRRDRATIEADQYERMDSRVQRLEKREEECREELAAEREGRHRDVSALRDELAAEKAERVTLQAIIQGQGEVRQAAAAAAAEVRLDEAKKAGTKKP